MTGGTLSDRERWDAKHAAAAGTGAHEPHEPEEPEAFVLRALALIPLRRGARALDLAAGRGRHALELARRGYEVEAWDVSPVGLAILAERAAAAGVEVETRVLDLLTGSLPVDAKFDLVIVVNFLDRPLYRRLAGLVRPGGHVVVTTFTTDRTGKTPSARHCLEPGELARGLAGFATLLAEERGGRAGCLARRRGPE